jgi:alkaline phosphatase D
MAELILLDTRLEGRDQQIYNYADPGLFAADRTILGREQKDWLLQQLGTPGCLWKLVASQVIFSELNVQWATKLSAKAKILQDSILDYWEGYPAERDEIIQHITDKKLNNVVILSASMHCALAFDVTKRATNYSRQGERSTYDTVTSKGSVAVEFSAPSITSANFDEMIGSLYASSFQSRLNKKLPAPINYNPNPHLKFADLQQHGYIILNLTKEKAEARFYFVGELSKRSKKEHAGETWYSRAGNNKLQSSQSLHAGNATTKSDSRADL